MSITEMILALRSNDTEAILLTVAVAADALEMLEERIAIMGETLTEKEWKDIERQSRRC